jgi:hypothetical protein
MIPVCEKIMAKEIFEVVGNQRFCRINKREIRVLFFAVG